MEFILITILTTLISDVYLQKNETVELRNTLDDKMKFIKGHLIHLLEILIPLLIVLLILFQRPVGTLEVIKYTLLISITHIVIDMLKCLLNKKFKKQVLFLVDQVAHLVTILYIYSNINLESTNIFPYIEAKVFHSLLIFAIAFIYTVRCGELYIDFFMEETFDSIVNKNLETITIEEDRENTNIQVAATDTGDEAYTSEVYPLKEGKVSILDTTGNDTGRYIGILERSIVLFLVVSNNYPSIALLLTGKSIARSKEFEDKEFAVKFIVGTFLSILIGIIGGEAFNFIIKYII